MNWEYHEIKPPEHLAEYIDCIWWENYAEIHPEKGKHLLVPDLSIELIFTPSVMVRYLPGTGEYKRKKTQLAGLRTTPQVCSVQESPVIGIRFKVSRFYRLSLIKMSETINNCLHPTICFGKSVSKLEREVFMAKSQEERIEKITSFFTDYLTFVTIDSDPVFEDIIRYIDELNGACVIGELPSLFSISASTIERKFRKNMGLTPKKYCSLLRFQKQFLSGQKSFRSYNSGSSFNYYDQAHFIKEVSKFSGLTPGQLASLKMGIQEAYFKKKWS
ncbi:helix-turn-helix domain-containing protein [Jiulongibacter sediminis]|uniref:HTH araC/xylS-type domain-containing protein n=1 Tax=Jiulongibacter sediminis TaxID=1605367 RepID=A0A0N8H9K9_9BACT|nr:AraC family transcriptional regulator [Jiulongibacter sediminis]KPM47660.1 hypothetical protein AFM12_14395 [Jiulongibacter sediminis]TBX23452.1 hypothetical protein TK44_14405 [Jiulongibacter sediminis]